MVNITNVMGLLMLMGVSAVVQQPVLLGTAANYVILSKTGVTTATETTAIVGNVGVSPIAAGAITGFGLILDSSGKFATSRLVTGKIYASDYTNPTPKDLTTAVSDMQIAYTDAAGRTTPDESELASGLIGGMTLMPGLYKWGTSVNIASDVFFSGNSTDVWVLQIAGELIVASGTKVVLIGGASANNIFWQVADQTTLETTSALSGIVLCQVAITMRTGANLVGRALSQTAVTLDSNSVTPPPVVTQTPSSAPSSSAPSRVPSGTPSSAPSRAPSRAPSTKPSKSPTRKPSKQPTKAPSATLKTIVVVPASATIIVGQVLTLVATGFDQIGAPIQATFTYGTSNNLVAKVSTVGWVTGVKYGTATITVSSGSVQRSVAITVR